MSLLDTWLPLAGGLVLLIAGGEFLVRGAVQVATRLGVSPLVIGLTLVGFGTSTPELVTSVDAALRGYPGIAYGNIVGSNVANILLILGLSALVYPIAVTSRALRRDSMVMLGVAVVFAAVAAMAPIGPAIGGVFVAALAAYVYLAFRQERGSPAPAGEAAHGAAHGAVYDKSMATQHADPALAPADAPERPLALSLLTAAAGLVAVVIGGSFFVDGAAGLARGFGISETVIGLTIVAVGTSMPELVTSVVAAVRRETDVAFGNIVGSNIYNILGIGGVTALMTETLVPAEIVAFDNYAMIGATLLVIAMALTGGRICRPEGGLLLAGYAAYVWWIWP
jgi:cation:H+ antiporter